MNRNGVSSSHFLFDEAAKMIVISTIHAALLDFVGWAGSARDLSDYGSVFQLAVGLNLVLSAYTEIRTDVENEIDGRIKIARSKFYEVLQEGRARCLRDDTAKGDFSLTETWLPTFNAFADEFYEHRSKLRHEDKEILIQLLTGAAASLCALLTATALADAFKWENLESVALSLALFIPAAIAIRRAIKETKNLRWRLVKASSYGSQISARYNCFFLPLTDDKRWSAAFKGKFKRKPPKQSLRRPEKDSAQPSAAPTAQRQA